MPIVNFNINQVLDKKIKKFIKDEGLSSKAEFFRFAALNFISTKPVNIEEAEAKRTLAMLKEAVMKKYSDKNFPSLEEQLRDL